MPNEAMAGQTACPYMLGAKGLKSQTCLGAKCMAWRWVDPPSRVHVIRCPKRDAIEEPSPRPSHVPIAYIWSPADESDDAGWYGPDRDDERRGYCGMAGPVGQHDR